MFSVTVLQWMYITKNEARICLEYNVQNKKYTQVFIIITHYVPSYFNLVDNTKSQTYYNFFLFSYFIQEWIGLISLKYLLCSSPPFPYIENSGVQYSYKIYKWFIILKFLQRIIIILSIVIIIIIILFEVMWCNCKSIEFGWVNLTSMQWQILYLWQCQSHVKIETNMGTGILAHLIKSEKSNI